MHYNTDEAIVEFIARKYVDEEAERRRIPKLVSCIMNPGFIFWGLIW